jgi:dienelactone hydrolase
LAATASAAAAPGVDSCVPKTAKTIRVRGGVLSLQAVLLGQGTRGVVFSNESDNSLCSWMPLAKRLARDGFRVALYDYSGAAPVSDVTAVTGALRRAGAHRIGLVGASEGAKASIAAAGTARASAVVSLSAERSLAGYGDLLPAARRLHAPILYLYAKDDPVSELNTPQLYAATRERDKRLVAFPGFDHGTALLAHPTVPGMIESFLRRTL